MSDGSDTFWVEVVPAGRKVLRGRLGRLVAHCLPAAWELRRIIQLQSNLHQRLLACRAFEESRTIYELFDAGATWGERRQRRLFGTGRFNRSTSFSFTNGNLGVLMTRCAVKTDFEHQGVCMVDTRKLAEALAESIDADSRQYEELIKWRWV